MTLELAAAGAKLLLYAAGGVAAGTTLATVSLRLPATRAGGLVRGSAAVALVAAAAGFVILLRQLGGGLEWALLRAVLDGPVGVALALQLGGGLLLLVGATVPPCSGLGALAFLASFGATGHAASHGLPQAVVTVAHVALASWWLGGLILVRAACASHRDDPAATVRRFSRLALVLVAALVATGAVLVWELVPIAGISTSYARTVLLKLLVVAAALAVAARNRLRHLPALASGDPRPLRRSVTLELALLLAVLSITTWLTTFESPHAVD